MTAIRKLTQGDNQYFFKMFRFVRPFAVPYAVSQFVYSLQGFAFSFILAAFSGNVMAAVLASDRDAIADAALVMVVMTMCFVVVLVASVYVNQILVEKALLDMKKLLFRAFIHSGVEKAGHSGENIAAINTDADMAAKLFRIPLLGFLQCLLSIVGSSIVMFAVDWRLGLAAFGIGALSFLMQHRFTGPLAQIGKERLETNSSGIKTLSNIFSGASVVRAYNMQNQALLTFDHDNKRLRVLDFKRGIISVWQNLFGTVEGWLTMITTFAFGGWLVVSGRLEFHLLMVVFVMSSALTSSLGSLGHMYANLQAPIAGAKRIFKILENAKARPISQEGAPTKEISGHRLCLENLSFSYMDAASETLKEINMEIEENKMVAIVGESGSGKSTLLRTIIGMYERESLGVSVGGASYGSVPIKDWRKNFAYVDQNSKLFDMSIRQNIAMGVGGDATEEEIVDAAKKAGAHGFISELENGYDSSCGEKGASLSGGQRQRIAIARALVRKAPVLVLDEITSALDKESERHILDTIESLRGSHTVLFTAHNLDSVASADKIAVMDNGRIKEMGTHPELMKKEGAYFKLFAKMH